VIIRKYGEIVLTEDAIIVRDFIFDGEGETKPSP